MNAITIHAVKKAYGKIEALKGIDLEIREGEFFGLLGPNGAGKTTLIGSIVGLVKPNAGEIKVFEHSVLKNPLETRKSIGFSPQEVNIDRFFNVRKTLEFQAGFYGYPPSFRRKRSDEMLEQFDLTDKAKVQFYKLSGGMQRRLLIARALMSKPKILILDEPSAGIDVELRYELWTYLRNLNRDGTTILLTTHYIDEAEALCERVAIINHGQLIEIGKPKDLIEKYCLEQVEITLDQALPKHLFQNLSGVEHETLKITGKAPRIAALTGELLSRIHQAGGRVTEIQVKHGSLEEVFVKLTGEPLAVEESKILPPPPNNFEENEACSGEKPL